METAEERSNVPRLFSSDRSSNSKRAPNVVRKVERYYFIARRFLALDDEQRANFWTTRANLATTFDPENKERRRKRVRFRAARR